MHKIFFYFFLFFFYSSIVNSSENINIKLIDLNYILNNSLQGKKIMQNLDNQNKSLSEKYLEIQRKLEEDKNLILSQQNILEKDIYNEKVSVHQKNINKFNEDRKLDLKMINDYKINETNKLLKIIDNMLIEYSKNNNISLILKKESLLISSQTLDITNIILDKLNKDFKNNN